MNEFNYLLLPCSGRHLKTVDIRTQQRGVQAKLLCEAADINFRMGKKKTLHTGWLGISVKETLKTDLDIDSIPEDTLQPKGIIISDFLCCSIQLGIP